MEERKTVFVLTSVYRSEDYCDETELRLFSNRESAVKLMQEKIKDIIETDDNLFKDGEPLENIVVESVDGSCWDAYEQGFFNGNSVSFDIQEYVVEQ